MSSWLLVVRYVLHYHPLFTKPQLVHLRNCWTFCQRRFRNLRKFTKTYENLRKSCDVTKMRFGENKFVSQMDLSDTHMTSSLFSRYSFSSWRYSWAGVFRILDFGNLILIVFESWNSAVNLGTFWEIKNKPCIDSSRLWIDSNSISMS